MSEEVNGTTLYQRVGGEAAIRRPLTVSTSASSPIRR